MGQIQWKPGDVAMRSAGYGDEQRSMFVPSSCPNPRHDNRPHWHHMNGGWDPADAGPTYRPLAVIDPEDREQVRAIADDAWPEGFGNTNRLQATLRKFADPKSATYREHPGAIAPWPEVGECHSSRRDDHECPQCAWQHVHDWVAWTHPDGGPRGGQPHGIPIRCSKCGGRKCDRDDCALQRHHGTTHSPVQP